MKDFKVSLVFGAMMPILCAILGLVKVVDGGTDSRVTNNIADSTTTPSDLPHPGYTNSNSKSYAKVQRPKNRQRRSSGWSGVWCSGYSGYKCKNVYFYSMYYARKNWWKKQGKWRFFPDTCCSTLLKYGGSCWSYSARYKFSCPDPGSCNGCIFPFKYNGVTYNGCTNQDWNKSWCATSINSDGSSKTYKECQDLCPGSCNGCIFPFKYNGVTYNGCTNQDWNKFWCATSINSDGSSKTSKKCQDSCPRHTAERSAVNGQWSSWSSWGACSRTCKSGTKKRTRTCTSPRPANGGKGCKNSGSETTICNEKPCDCPIGYVKKGSGKRKRRFAKNSSRTSRRETWMEVIQDEIPDISLPLQQNENSTFIQKETDNYDVKVTAHRQRRSYPMPRLCSVIWRSRLDCPSFAMYTKYGYADTPYFFAKGKVWMFIHSCCPSFQSICHTRYGYLPCPPKTKTAPPTEYWTTKWSTWSICEGSCEKSTKKRMRGCFKSNGNHVCTKKYIESKPCEVKVENIKLCGRLLSNNDVANLCCFIIRSKSLKKTFILTDHILAPDFDGTCGTCAYSPYEEDAAKSGRGSVKTEEKWCLKDKDDENKFQIGPHYTCCSQHNGAFCKRFGRTTSKHNIVSGSFEHLYWEYLQDKTTDRALVQSCSNECKEIAKCPNPGNEWCQNSALLGTDTSDKSISTKRYTNCEPTILENEEPVKQSAELVPNALTHDTGIGKRSASWGPCKPYIMWQFNCNMAMHYMLYQTKRNWYYIQRKNKERYFKHDCCPSFQTNSKCWKKKIFKDNWNDNKCE